LKHRAYNITGWTWTIQHTFLHVLLHLEQRFDHRISSLFRSGRLAWTIGFGDAGNLSMMTFASRLIIFVVAVVVLKSCFVIVTLLLSH
jgi:hypothetical protein